MVKVWYWDRYSLYLYNSTLQIIFLLLKDGREPRLRRVKLCMKRPGMGNIVCESQLHRNSFILLFWLKSLFTWSLNVNAWLMRSLPRSVYSYPVNSTFFCLYLA